MFAAIMGIAVVSCASEKLPCEQSSIIDGSDPEDIYRLLDGEEIGTVFLANREGKA